jgi:hypothetical protein
MLIRLNREPVVFPAKKEAWTVAEAIQNGTGPDLSM